eukprot:scaffold7737_cov24-Prasinocladus_malaysianus.AAC.2
MCTVLVLVDESRSYCWSPVSGSKPPGNPRPARLFSSAMSGSKNQAANAHVNCYDPLGRAQLF